LVRTTSASGRDKVDHGKTGADDVCNSAAGAMILATAVSRKIHFSAAAGSASIDTETGRRLFQHGDFVSDGVTLRRIKPEIPPPPADLSMVWSEEKQAYVRPWIDPNAR
jgi:hypothetical protein